MSRSPLSTPATAAVVTFLALLGVATNPALGQMADAPADLPADRAPGGATSGPADGVAVTGTIEHDITPEGEHALTREPDRMESEAGGEGDAELLALAQTGSAPAGDGDDGERGEDRGEEDAAAGEGAAAADSVDFESGDIITCYGPAPLRDWRYLVGGQLAVGSFGLGNDPAGRRELLIGAGVAAGRKWGRLSVIADYTYGALSRPDAAGEASGASGASGAEPAASAEPTRRTGFVHRLGLAGRVDLLALGGGSSRLLAQIYAEAGVGRRWVALTDEPTRAGVDVALGGGAVFAFGVGRSGTPALLHSLGVRALIAEPVGPRVACRGECTSSGQRGVAVLIVTSLAWGR